MRSGIPIPSWGGTNARPEAKGAVYHENVDLAAVMGIDQSPVFLQAETLDICGEK